MACRLGRPIILPIGELLALRWRALDLEIGTLAVRESVYEGKVQRPKTQKSRRTIPLGPHAIASLKAHRDRSTRKSADDLVFRTSPANLSANRSSWSACYNRQRNVRGSGG
jgi:integrase